VNDEIPQGICIFCGTARPTNVAVCPTCKRTWIDRRLSESPGDALAPPDEGVPVAPPPVSADEPPGPHADTPEGPPEPAVGSTAEMPEPEPIDTIPLEELLARLEASPPSRPPQPEPEPAVEPPPEVPEPEPDEIPLPPGLEPDEAPEAVRSGAAAAQDPPEPPTRSLIGMHDRRGWWVALGIAAAVLSIYLLVFFLLLRDSSQQAATASTTTTSTSETSTTAATTTSEATTTTTEATTTTTTIPPIDPIGEAIPLSELDLGAFALGPLDLGAGSTDALGRLVATFGQPDGHSTAGEADGLCPGSTGSTYRWGGLTVILLDEGDAQALVGYRLTPAPDGETHDTDDLTTLSGLRLGQTVGDIRSIYANSSVSIIDREGTPHFVLLRSSDQRTLLWGPVESSDDTGTVIGISSPLWCDQGPAAS
jgi:hypothetical protein